MGPSSGENEIIDKIGKMIQMGNMGYSGFLFGLGNLQQQMLLY